MSAPDSDATPPDGTKVDVIEAAREALPAAHETTVAQANLQGHLDQAKADEVKANTAMQTIAGIIDKVRALLDEAKPAADLIPEPYRTYVLAVIRAVDTVDDALSKIGL